MPYPAAMSPGLTGKIPAQGDFVRFNASDPAALELTHWLEKGHESIRRHGNSLPRVPTCFVFTTASTPRALIGALVPSRDRVGRVFPLAVFASAGAADLAECFALVSLAFSRFISACAAMLEAADTLVPSEIDQRLQSLPLPGPDDWTFAEQDRRTVLGQSSFGLTRELSGPGGSVGAYYGFRTFLAACKAVRGEEPTKTRFVLDCPLSDKGPLAWLELAERLLDWKTRPPSCLWTEDMPPRLLLSLGPMTANTLSYLVSSEQTASMFWPLKTSQKAAVEAAQQALSTEQRRAIENTGTSLDTLFSCLAR